MLLRNLTELIRIDSFAKVLFRARYAQSSGDDTGADRHGWRRCEGSRGDNDKNLSKKLYVTR